MNIRSQLAHLIFSIMTILCWQSAASPLLQAKQPNVLLIMTDDQGFGDVASHGNPDISTPVHDRIAAEGARFDRFYVSPVCAPTRAALLTGRYHPRTGVHGVTRGYEMMRDNELTVAEVLQKNGYKTGAFGKWHNGESYPHHPNGQGFEEFVGFCAGHWNNYFDTKLEHNGETFRSDGFIIDAFTDRAIDWIQEQQEADKPWFCYMPYNTPHTPWQVPDRFWDKYQDKGLKPQTACAYAMVENIDYNMGRIVSHLEKTNDLDNTIVIFLTDNGANSDRYNAGMRGRKGSNHEGGTRVPLFIRYPKMISAGLVVPQITAHIDLLPTLVEMTDSQFEPANPIDGISLVPLLTKEKMNWPDRTLFTMWRDRGAARTQRWRAVDLKKGGWALFDMQADPGEKNNVAEEHPEVLKQLKQAYQDWWEDVSSAGFEAIPTHIGHSARPHTELSAHYAHLQPEQGDGINYVGNNGWANDYVATWTNPDAYPMWPVKVVQPGTYKVSIDYVAPEEAVGSVLKAELAGSTAQVEVTEAHNPPHLPSPDRISRQGNKEVYEKNWKRIEVGQVTVDKAGEYELQLHGVSKPGSQFPDIKTIVVEKVND